MSIQFSDTTNFKGLVQLYEKEIGVAQGTVSGNSTLLKEFAAKANVAWDDYMYLWIKSSGKWQGDDSNHTDYPFIYTNLVDGQRDYTFTTDEQGNIILDIYKVAILPSATATLYQEITPVDQQTTGHAADMVADNTTEGVPYQYDKTGNGILLDPIPSYNATSGLKIYINREASYFTSSDTTKKPGCPGIHHKYFYLKPALDYARIHSLGNYGLLREEVVSMEGDEERGIIGTIERYFGRRSKDDAPRITHKKINYI